MRVGRRNFRPRRKDRRWSSVKVVTALGLVTVIVSMALLFAASQPDEFAALSLVRTVAPSASPLPVSLPVGDTPGTLKVERGQFSSPKPLPAFQALIMKDRADEPMPEESAPELRLIATIQLLGDRSEDVTWLFSHLESCFGHELAIKKAEMTSTVAEFDSSELNKTLILPIFENPFDWAAADSPPPPDRSLRRRLADSGKGSVLEDALTARAEVVESILGLEEDGAVVWSVQREFLVQEGTRRLLHAISQLTGFLPQCDAAQLTLESAQVSGDLQNLRGASGNLTDMADVGEAEHPREVMGSEVATRIRDLANWTIEERIGYWPEDTLEESEEDLYRLPIEISQEAYEAYITAFSGEGGALSSTFAWSPEKQAFAEKQKIAPEETDRHLLLSGPQRNRVLLRD